MVPFFGGADDREALALGVRMAEHPGISLHVVKFAVTSGTVLVRKEAKKDEVSSDDGLSNDEVKFTVN